jgi:hypothetical protein
MNVRQERAAMFATLLSFSFILTILVATLR